LRAETRRDSTTEGKRQAFVADAARPTAAAKREYFTRWFADQALNEEWVTSSLRAFHDPERGDLTRAYLVPALDTLPWIQQNRRIFFLGSWLGATIGGQTSADALSDIDAWLRAHPALAPDLRQKVLQSRDELERTVAIRRAFGKRAM
jgi:aminopeptidase N